MTAAQITARLVKVRSAIDAVLDGKVASYSISGRSLANLSISELQTMENNLEAKLARVQASGRTASVVRFRGAG